MGPRLCVSSSTSATSDIDHRSSESEAADLRPFRFPPVQPNSSSVRPPEHNTHTPVVRRKLFIKQHRHPIDQTNPPDRVQLRNMVIGNNRQKALLIENDLVARLLKMATSEGATMEMRREVVFILNSLAKGSEKELGVVIEAGGARVLLHLLDTNDDQLVTACARCLRTLFTSRLAPIDQLYADTAYVQLLLHVSHFSPITQEYVMEVFAHVCTPEHQITLLNEGIIPVFVPLLFRDNIKVLLSVLSCFASLTHDNFIAASYVFQAEHAGITVPERCDILLARCYPVAVQLAAAKCLVYLFRAGVIGANHRLIVDRAMPTIVRCARGECLTPSDIRLRVDAIKTLAYATEQDVSLQRLTADNNQCLREMLKCVPANTPISASLLNNETLESYRQLEPAALTAIASLVMNEEEIRRRIQADNFSLTTSVERAKAKTGEEQVYHLHAIGRCLHALSRSVEQLRTTFHERPVWKLLLEMAQSSNEELVAISSAALCNLCLDFSPCKREIVDAGLVEVLSSLVRRDSPCLRLNGVWGLMNLAYRADEKLKMTIVKTFGSDQFLRLLTEATSDSPIVLRTLGLIRNVLSHGNDPKAYTHNHIDEVMAVHGNSIIQAVIYVLEDEYSSDAKEMALCILSNIAAGASAKEFIVANEDILRKVTNYMQLAGNSSLQIAATFCIFNLVCKEDDGYDERQAKLRDFGVHKLLQQLLQTSDNELYERAKLTLNQF
uniref:Armadillo repeat-containing protein 8 n=2 Tax=Plectus sambesii TaxID=2011161 RepID=A0A914WI92_9BILA